MGHLCPHVHCHVYPMGQTDDPHALIDIQQGDTVLEGPEWDERVAIMTVAVLRRRTTDGAWAELSLQAISKGAGRPGSRRPPG